MAKFEVYVDCSATIILEVEAETQKKANDHIANLITKGDGWFCEDHRNEWSFFDPCVYRDNEDEEEDE